MEIYLYIFSRTNCNNYLGEGVNDSGRIQVFFKIKDCEGNPRVMVICVSDELYPCPEKLFQEAVRVITAVFFISEEEADERLLDKIFHE